MHPGAFFFVDRCVDSPTLNSFGFMQGIVGLGFTALAVPGSDAFIDRFFAAHLGMPRNFAIQMCAQQGAMWFGGVDRYSFLPSSLRASDLAPNSSIAPWVGDAGLLYTPLGSASYYNVFPSTVYLGNHSLGFVSGDWPSPNIVDSGTTLLHLPRVIYTAIVKALLADSQFSRWFRAAPEDNFFEHPSRFCEAPLDLTVDWPDLQQSLPTLSIQFANGLVLTMDGLGSYLLPCSNAYRVFTPGISPYDGGLIGGWPLMNQFLTVHDLAGMKIGFAVVANCSSSKVALRANVSFWEVPECDPSSGSSCIVNCEAGMYCTSASAVPQPCPVAHECPSGSRAPRLCSAGRYCPQPQMALGIPCPSGQYESEPGRTSCGGRCRAFWHQNSEGSTHCDGWSSGAWIVFIVGPLVLVVAILACWLCGACGNKKASCCALEGEEELAAARAKRRAEGDVQRNGQRRPEGGWAAMTNNGGLAGALGTTTLLADGASDTPKPLSPSPTSSPPPPAPASPSQEQMDAERAAAAVAAAKAEESANRKRQQENTRLREDARNQEPMKPYSPPSAAVSASASLPLMQGNFPPEPPHWGAIRARAG